MGYPYELNTVLLEGWQEWSTGRSDIPGKNVTFKDGRTGSVLIGPEVITIYTTDLDNIFEDEEIAFLDSATKVEELAPYFTEEQLDELTEMSVIYQEYEDSYVREDVKHGKIQNHD